MWIELLLLLVAALTAIMMGFAVLFNEGGPLARRRMFFISSLAATIWTICIVCLILIETEVFLLETVKLYYAAMAVMGWAAICLAYVFFGRRKKVVLMGVLTAVPLVGVLVMMFGWPELLISSVSAGAAGAHAVVRLNWVGHVVFSAYFLVCCAVAIGFMVSDLWAARDLQMRHQARAVLLAHAAYFLTVIWFNLFLPGIGNDRLIWLGPLGVMAIAIMLYWAAIRYRLFDFREFAIKVLSYVLVAAPVFILYVVVFSYVVGRMFEGEEVSIAVYVLNLSTVMIAAAVLPIAGRLKKWLYWAAYPDSYSVKDVTARLNEAVAVSRGMDQMLVMSAREARKVMGVESVRFVVLDRAGEGGSVIKGASRSRLSDDEEAVVTDYMRRSVSSEVLEKRIPDDEPVKVVFRKRRLAMAKRIEYGKEEDGHVVGYVLVGARRSGRNLLDKDLEAISTIADIMLLAIENERYYEQVQGFNENLRKEIRAATRSLRETNARLQKLDATKDEFVNMASHQLRTPLTSIKGYISMMIDGDVGSVTPTQKKLLEEVYASSNKMVHIVNDFLDVSRLNTGKFVIDRVPLDLGTVVREEVSSIMPMAKAAKVEVKCEIEKKNFEMELDASKIRQVVCNMIDNAIYYSHPGDTVTVRLGKKDGKVIFEVEDQGIGVPKSEQKELFQKFYRASNARKKRPDGTGVGLFLARKVVTALGGEIIFRSEEEKGSVFGFWLKDSDG